MVGCDIIMVLKCPVCNSDNLIKIGKCVVKNQWTQRYLCKNCLKVTYKPVVEDIEGLK
jgi:transposase-like protein